ncbi:MAG: SGNH/GDSL hydrolase family protein [Acidimicrobiales bacterium]
MGKVSRIDRTIGVGLVVLLLALLGLAVAHRSGPDHVATPGASSTTATSTTASPAGVPSSATAASASRVGEAATPTSSPSQPAPAAPLSPVAGPVSAVGDSIMLDIEPYLQADISGVRVDGLVSRQFETGIAVVQAERAAGTLGRVLVVELGTNGTVTSADVDAMMQAASGVSRVVFVNIDVPRPWEAGDNAVLAEGVARYPGTAVLADWYTLSSGHPEWFTSDQVHLQPAGAEALANLVAQSA